jgi:hypothetical protein
MVTTKAPIVMAMKMRSATGPNILNTPKQISPQAKTKIIELSSWESPTTITTPTTHVLPAEVLGTIRTSKTLTHPGYADAKQQQNRWKNGCGHEGA